MDRLVVVKFHTNIANRWLFMTQRKIVAIFLYYKVIWSCFFGGLRFFRTRCIKHPVLPDWVKPSSVNFDIRALWRSALSVRVPGCQKITNDSSTPSDTGCFTAVPTWQQWASKGYSHSAIPRQTPADSTQLTSDTVTTCGCCYVQFIGVIVHLHGVCVLLSSLLQCHVTNYAKLLRVVSYMYTASQMTVRAGIT